MESSSSSLIPCLHLPYREILVSKTLSTFVHFLSCTVHTRVSELQLRSHRDTLAFKRVSLSPRTEGCALKSFEELSFSVACYRLTIKFLPVSVQLHFIFRIYKTGTWLRRKSLAEGTSVEFGCGPSPFRWISAPPCPPGENHFLCFIVLCLYFVFLYVCSVLIFQCLFPRLPGRRVHGPDPIAPAPPLLHRGGMLTYSRDNYQGVYGHMFKAPQFALWSQIIYFSPTCKAHSLSPRKALTVSSCYSFRPFKGQNIPIETRFRFG